MPALPSLHASLSERAISEAAAAADRIQDRRELNDFNEEEPHLAKAVGVVLRDRPDAELTLLMCVDIGDFSLGNPAERRTFQLERADEGLWALTLEQPGEPSRTVIDEPGELARTLVREFSRDERTRGALLSAYEAAPLGDDPANPARFVENDPRKRGFGLLIKDVCLSAARTEDMTQRADRLIAKAVGNPEYLAELGANKWALGLVVHGTATPARAGVERLLQEVDSVVYVAPRVIEAEFARRHSADDGDC